MRIRFRLLNPTPVEGGNGSSTTTETTKPETTATTPATTTTTNSKADGFEALAAKHSNDGVGLARNLWDQLQAANAKVAELTGKVAPEGALVLKGDQAKAWNQYTALGKPEDLKTAIAEGTEAKGQVTKFNREKLVGQVARLAGFDPEVLTTLAGDLDFEIADETVKGKAVQVAKVKVGETSTVLGDYAAKNWAKFMPSLKPSSSTTPQKLGTPPGRITGQINQPVVTQSEGPASQTPTRPVRLFGGF